MCTWGTAILIKRHLVDKVIEVSKDTDGKFVIIVIECDRTKYTLINIYAPTQLNENEQIMFLHTLRDELVLHEYENIILGGDFNIVLNPCLDKKGGNININRNARYRKELTTFIETLNLCDVWRNRNADKFNFTWHCKKTKIFCRLDFWLIGEQLINNVMKTSILPTINSDHKLIHISLKTSYQKTWPIVLEI
jgi:exonuclease III